MEAHIRVGATAATERVTTDFDTVLLYSANRGGGGKSGVNIEEATEYDDEVRRGQVLSLTSFQYLSDKTPPIKKKVGEGGEIDIGEIASQYLSLEMGM